MWNQFFTHKKYVEDDFQNHFFTHKNHTQNLYIIIAAGTIKNNALGTFKETMTDSTIVTHHYCKKPHKSIATVTSMLISTNYT